MDQCKNCEVRGNINKCLETECSYHELWMVKELKRIYENEIVMSDMLLDAIESIVDGKEPSDFALSFSIVRRVYETINDNYYDNRDPV